VINKQWEEKEGDGRRGEDLFGFVIWPVLFIRARMPSMAGYSYGNSLDVRIKLNTDPNLTPNPIRTHDRMPNPNRPMSQKKLCARWESNS